MATVIVRSGDTLWSLATKHLGDPFRWPEIWAANAKRILAEQRSRQLHPDRPEDWIFPGTPLEIG